MNSRSLLYLLVTYKGPANIDRLVINTATKNAKKEDRVQVISGKKKGSFGKFVCYDGSSVDVQCDDGFLYHPSPTSVRVLRYKDQMIKYEPIKKILVYEGEIVNYQNTPKPSPLPPNKLSVKPDPKTASPRLPPNNEQVKQDPDNADPIPPPNSLPVKQDPDDAVPIPPIKLPVKPYPNNSGLPLPTMMELDYIILLLQAFRIKPTAELFALLDPSYQNFKASIDLIIESSREIN